MIPGRMWRVATWVLLGALLAPGTALTQPAPQRPEGQIPDRGRPTESGDEIPLFDYDAYFPGTWEIGVVVEEGDLVAALGWPTAVWDLAFRALWGRLRQRRARREEGSQQDPGRNTPHPTRYHTVLQAGLMARGMTAIKGAAGCHYSSFVAGCLVRSWLSTVYTVNA